LALLLEGLLDPRCFLVETPFLIQQLLALVGDRLYQMEMSLRAVFGTVSEVIGPAYLALDKGKRLHEGVLADHALIDHILVWNDYDPAAGERVQRS
jgi:hypothetical protein